MIGASLFLLGGERMKGKWKKAVPYLLTIVVTICVCFAVVAVVLRPQTLSIGTVDLNTVADGEYCLLYTSRCV